MTKNVDDLLEENLSLKYQVQKLQAVLSQSQRKRSDEDGDGDVENVEDEEKFKHQISKLQAFMSKHNNQSSVLKEKLKEASDYVHLLEHKRKGKKESSASTSTSTKRGGVLARKAAAGRNNSNQYHNQSPPMSERVRSTLGASYSQAKDYAVNHSDSHAIGTAVRPPPPQREVLVKKKTKKKTSASSTTRTNRNNNAGGGVGAGGVLDNVTPADLDYIFKEVINLKQKLARAESKLQHADAVQKGTSPLAQILGDEVLKQEMKEMKEGQQALVQQIKAQQEVITDIFQHLSVSGIIRQRQSLPVTSSSIAQHDLAHHHDVYHTTRHPVISMQPTIRQNKAIRLKVKKPEGLRRKSPIRIQADRKFSRLSAGYSSVERRLNFDKEWDM